MSKPSVDALLEKAMLAPQAVCPVALSAFLYDDDDEPKENPFVVDGIAVLPLMGYMTKQTSWWSRGLGTGVLADLMDAAATDPAVKGVLLMVDSPGGEMGGTDDLARASARCAHEKPLYVAASGSCCSAAYYVACEAHELWATPSTLVGSVGIIARVLDVSAAYEKSGVKPYVFKTGELKGGLVAGESMTDSIKASYEELVDAYMAMFEAQVDKRPTAAANWDTVKEGKVYMAEDGRKVGLVDRIGTKADALAELRQTVGLVDSLRR